MSTRRLERYKARLRAGVGLAKRRSGAATTSTLKKKEKNPASSTLDYFSLSPEVNKESCRPTSWEV